MGTPDLAATILEALLGWEGCRVIAAYCQPDRPAGRGMALQSPPVKTLALARGIPVRQPVNFIDAAEVAALRDLAPDYLAVAAYGLILPPSVLDIPSRMPLNVHTSLLPRYRGAAPIQRALMNGEEETGVSVMRMEKGLDTGPVILQERVPVRFSDTAADLRARLAEVGGKTLVDAIRGLEEGRLTPEPQDEKHATYAPKLSKRDGVLDFSRTGKAIYDTMRAVTPWPGAFAILQRAGEAALPVTFVAGSFRPGVPHGKAGGISPSLVDGKLAVFCADGVYLVAAVKPAGKKIMDAGAFMNGYLTGRVSPLFAPPSDADST